MAQNDLKPTIRHGSQVRDAPACAAVYAEYVLEGAASFEIVPPTAAEFEARIERIQRTHPWLVAEVQGRVVGFAYGSPHHERAAYRWAADVSVYIESGSHRRGIGRALYQCLFGKLRAQRLLIACAGVTLPNDASVALHESFGFAPVGVYRGIGYKAGAWRDVGWWQLELARPSGDPPPEPKPPPPPDPTPVRPPEATPPRDRDQ